MNNHRILEDGTELTFQVSPSRTCRFRLNRLKGQGGTAVCYEAVDLDTEEIGYLREYIPVPYVENGVLQRNGETNSIFCTKQIPAFEEDKQEYVRSLREVNRIKNSRNRFLNNFIPLTTIYETTDGMVYIWNPQPVEAINFDEYLCDIALKPVDCCEKKLLNILNVILVVAKFARAIHATDLLVMDIKPENLSVEYDSIGESRYEINTNKISYFDIDSIQYQKARAEKPMGSPGFSAPEIRKGIATPAADIYSIGAMLYYAVVVVDEGGGVYKNRKYLSNRQYSEIRNAVRDSLLIRDSVINSGEDVMSRLVEILKKSLHFNYNLRYRSCDEMITDLEALIAILSPTEMMERLGMDVDVSLTDMESRLREINLDAIMQLAMWHSPIYEGLDPKMRDANIAVIGDGDIVFTIIDTLLQCQMVGHRLVITVLTGDPEGALRKYTDFRPAAGRLLRINGVGPEEGSCLDFREADIIRNYNNYSVFEAISEGLERSGRQFIYGFVALRKDEINTFVAKRLKETGLISGSVRPVLFQSEPSPDQEGISPICIRQRIDDLSDDQEYFLMERMAYNAHVIWRHGDVDHVKEYRQFKENRYNYRSSLKLALSMKYKLYSIGMGLGDPSLREKIGFLSGAESGDRELLEELAYVEHLRWVYAFMSDGWDAPLCIDGSLNYKKCIAEAPPCEKNGYRYQAKIESEKQHACMVIGRGPEPDELDRVTEELYQEAVKYLKLQGIEDAEGLVSRVDYKEYDRAIIRSMVHILFDRHVVGNYDYIPATGSEPGEIDVTPKQLTEITSQIKEYTNRLLYDRGWRYGKSFSYERKKTPELVPFDELGDKDAGDMEEVVKEIIRIVWEGIYGLR